MLIGVYEPNSPGSYGQVDSFAQQAGFTPRITSYYSTFTMPFPTAFAEQAASKGTMLLVQWQPRGTTNAAVASGTDDVYIEQFAQAVAALDQQVIISYGQEMNGNWYEWGAAPGGEATSDPADYIAAYQHVWEIFQQQHVRNVTWLWDPNVSYTGSTPLRSCTRATSTWTGSGWTGTSPSPPTRSVRCSGRRSRVARTVSFGPTMTA